MTERGATQTRGSWPVPIRGIVETVVATRGPDGRWNLAALGLRAGDPVGARTWGQTRTRRNFSRRGAGIILFVPDPILFVEAALDIVERADPVPPEADAWAAVSVSPLDRGRTSGTNWVDWAIHPRAGTVHRRRVSTINRGRNAVVEATVAASRLGVSGYDDDVLRRRIDRYGDIVDRCGSDRDVRAFDRLRSLLD